MLALTLLGAGCSSSSPASPNTANPFPAAANEEASQVPADIPTYPSGFVIAVTGNATTVHVAQSTPDPSDRVIEWTKTEFARRGATLEQTSQEGSSTNLTFETSGNRYIARIDAPRDGGAYLTISREPNDAVMGQ